MFTVVIFQISFNKLVLCSRMPFGAPTRKKARIGDAPISSIFGPAAAVAASAYGSNRPRAVRGQARSRIPLNRPLTWREKMADVGTAVAALASQMGTSKPTARQLRKLVFGTTGSKMLEQGLYYGADLLSRPYADPNLSEDHTMKTVWDDEDVGRSGFFTGISGRREFKSRALIDYNLHVKDAEGKYYGYVVKSQGETKSGFTVNFSQEYEKLPKERQQWLKKLKWAVENGYPGVQKMIDKALKGKQVPAKKSREAHMVAFANAFKKHPFYVKMQVNKKMFASKWANMWKGVREGHMPMPIGMRTTFEAALKSAGRR